MLAMARERAAGTHPYLAVPEQIRRSREALGPEALIASELTVVLDPDATSAGVAAREFLAVYLRLDNYTRMMLRNGFTAADIAGGGSDRLVDALVPHGTPPDIVAAIRAQLAAGADHVCIQIRPPDEASFVVAARDVARELAR